MAAAKSAPQVQTDSRTDNQSQGNIIQAMKPLLSSVLAVNVLVSDQALISGTTIVSHGLNQPVQGWLIVDINAAATVYSTASTNTTLTLVSSAAVTASILVF